MLIYRLENNDGHGPYISGQIHDVPYDLYPGNRHEPADGLRIFKDLVGERKWVCGYTDLHEFFRVFDVPFLRALYIRTPQRFCIYDVEEEAHVFDRISAQSMFNRDLATLRDKYRAVSDVERLHPRYINRRRRARFTTEWGFLNVS